MVKPLTFKGDKPKSSKKRKHTQTHASKTDPSSAAAPPSKLPKQSGDLKSSEAVDPDASAEDQSWVSADTTTDISGPILICLPSDPPTAIASDIHGKVFASELENLIEADVRTAEPHDVRQVWVATKVAGTEGFSLKGGHGRYVLLSYLVLTKVLVNLSDWPM
jgi:protein FRG1